MALNLEKQLLFVRKIKTDEHYVILSLHRYDTDHVQYGSYHDNPVSHEIKFLQTWRSY